MTSIIDHKNKYLMYRSKCNFLQLHLIDNEFNQIGGENLEKIKKQLTLIKKSLESKGYSYWFDETGKLLAVGKNQKESKLNLIAKIKKKKKNTLEKIEIKNFLKYLTK